MEINVDTLFLIYLVSVTKEFMMRKSRLRTVKLYGRLNFMSFKVFEKKKKLYKKQNTVKFIKMPFAYAERYELNF